MNSRLCSVPVEILRLIFHFVQEGYDDEVPVHLIYTGPESDALHLNTTTNVRRHDKPRLYKGNKGDRPTGSLLPLMQTSKSLRDQAQPLYRSTTFHLVSLGHLDLYRKSPFCKPGLVSRRCGVYMDSWEHGKNRVQIDALFEFQQWHGKLVLFNPKERVISHSVVRTELIAQLVGLRDGSWKEYLGQGAMKLISSIEVDHFGDIYLVPRREEVEDHSRATSLYGHNVHDFLHLMASFARHFRSSVYVCILPKRKDAHTRDRPNKDTTAITKPTHRCWVSSSKAGYISSIRHCDTDGELSLLPTQRFRDECKSFADLKINLNLLRKMNDARLWLRVVDPEHELNPRYIRRLCASTISEESSVSWAANEREAAWAKILARGEVIERWRVLPEGPCRHWGVRVQPGIYPLWAFEDT